jgi:hypothetical protein
MLTGDLRPQLPVEAKSATLLDRNFNLDKPNSQQLG